VPDTPPRRRVLVASATALPVLLAAAGCRSSDLFAGPDPLAGRPRLGHDVVTLQAVIAAEENLVHLYRTAINGDSGAIKGPQHLKPLLVQHEQHLASLRGRLVVPAGMPTPRPSQASAPARVTVPGLLAAERASAAGLVRRLASVQPALAQLFASIAASDITHVAVLRNLS
jgi:hypothetical protein